MGLIFFFFRFSFFVSFLLRKSGKTLNMILEQEGRCTADVGQRSELSANVWTFDTAAEPNDGTGTSNYRLMTPAVLIDTIRTYLLSKGENTLNALIDSFKVIDGRGYGVLDRQEFIWGLRDFGIVLNDIESNIILNYFDANGDGAITIEEFSNAIGQNVAVDASQKDSDSKK